MTNVNYRGNRSSTVNSFRAPSPNIWWDCPFSKIQSGEIGGRAFFDDFERGGLLTAPTTIAALVGNGWSGFSSDASQVAFDDVSGIKLMNTTVDHATSIFQEQHPFNISRSHGKLWFEVRFKIALTATTENSFFLGLMDTTAATVAIPLTTAGALADVNLIGFFRPEADILTFDFAHKADGVTAVTTNDGLAAIAADTYLKAGFVYDPKDFYVRSYISGIEQASYATVPSAASGGSGPFPNDIALGIVLAMAVGAGASDNILNVDWVKVAQLDVS